MRTQEQRQPETVAYFHIRGRLEPQWSSLSTRLGYIGGMCLPAWCYEEVDAFIGSYRNSLEEIRADVERGCFALLCGHFTARDLIVGCGAGLNFRKATTLREAVKRLISEYFYSISTMHKGREATLKKFPTLEAWVYENTETEVISGFLEEYRGESAERIAARLLDEYAFVGLTEAMGESCRAFAGLFGHEWSSETPKMNANASRADPVDSVLLKVLE